MGYAVKPTSSEVLEIEYILPKNGMVYALL